jgi:hypothetical protein
MGKAETKWGHRRAAYLMGRTGGGGSSGRGERGMWFGAAAWAG